MRSARRKIRSVSFSLFLWLALFYSFRNTVTYNFTVCRRYPKGSSHGKGFAVYVILNLSPLSSCYWLRLSTINLLEIFPISKALVSEQYSEVYNVSSSVFSLTGPFIMLVMTLRHILTICHTRSQGFSHAGQTVSLLNTELLSIWPLEYCKPSISLNSEWTS